MIKTPVCELFQIEYPIFQGGMAWVADASLAAAVSNAGGLGIIAGMNSNGEQLREEIRKCRERTQKPFGVNVMLMSPFVEEVARTVVEEHVPVLTTGAGNPGEFMPAWLEAGIKVVPVVASVGFARLAEKRGACAVVAEGAESGGHIGKLHTMALVPQICDAVKIPVLAAGGIGDGRGIAAALMLGAQGVQVGTRFLVARECTISPVYKEKVRKAKELDTIVTGASLGDAVRSLKTPFSREFEKKERGADVSKEELEKFGAGALRRAAREGDARNGCFLAGEIAGLVKKEQTAKEMIEEMFEEAEKRLGGVSQWVK
ncbi:MAG: nitronate monooxygenase [Oscillospiraceae bacterium]|jgi:enoyl-[acyl-carrier protein] reductase II|nr:nitronate monooxygenase [Oscillospiraceae bacterium]MCI2035912.1 nitronate monooxygenase [Oscillospiraceae bacterium]